MSIKSQLLGRDDIAVVTPIIGEFGWTLFEVQDKVRHFFNNTTCKTKLVIAPHSLRYLFEGATHIVELPDEWKDPHLPECLGKQYRPVPYFKKLIQWTENQVRPTEMLVIPYEMQPHKRWECKSEHKLFNSSIREWEPHVCVSARNVPERGENKNWSRSEWDNLVKKVKRKWKLPIISVGLPEDTYTPKGTIPIECDSNDYLETAVSCFNSASFSFSSNSGTTHLSLLSGCPTFSWGDSDSLTERMEVGTNPFKVACRCVNSGWQPNGGDIFNELETWYEEKVCKQQLV